MTEVTSTPPPMAQGAINLSAPEPMATTSAPVMATPIMENGGQTATTGGSISDFFKNINWLEVGFMMLGSAALIYTIYYYRVEMNKNKLANNRTAKQIDELKMNLQTQMKGKYKEIV